MTPTLTKAVIRDRRDDYLRRHPPDTGYTRRVVEQVLAAQLPNGTHLLCQIALQYDGATAGGDLVANTEKRLPYAYSYSLDVSSDCLVFVRNVIDLLYGRSIGTYTEDAYLRNKNKQVPWADQRPGDLLLWKLGDRNPHATHAALAIGNGLMLHTTSKSNPLRVEKVTKYSAASRSGTGCFRVLTQAEWESQIVQPGWAEGDRDMIVMRDPRKMVVARLQRRLGALGYDLGTYKSIIDGKRDGSDGAYGTKTKAAVAQLQKDREVETENIGAADDVTRLALAEASAGR